MRQGWPIARAGQVIGLLGGSFDPPHQGHAHITREALKRFGLDRVWWLVSPGNPLKPEGPAPLVKRMEAARAVMDHSRHVMLQSEGAETFAREQGLEIVDPAFFFTERRWAAMERALGGMGLDIPPRPEGAPDPEPVQEGMLERDALEHRFGTVGVVALDEAGNIAAGTSTGGLTAKRWGRVGDSPIIGAGTYANNESCGVSATGTGAGSSPAAIEGTPPLSRSTTSRWPY